MAILRFLAGLGSVLLLACILACGLDETTSTTDDGINEQSETTSTTDDSSNGVAESEQADNERTDDGVSESSLPKHEVNIASGSRSQIRAIAGGESNWSQLAEKLAASYSDKANLFLVDFFDSASALEDWDGSGALRDSDWAHWRARVVVDNGVARDVRVVTSEERTVAGDIAASAINDEIAKLKLDVCVQLEKLLEFKDRQDFKEFGFGAGGRYNKWLTDVQALQRSQKDPNNPIPLGFRIRGAPAGLMGLGMEYVRGETDYTRQYLPELKETIGYADYLESNKRPERFADERKAEIEQATKERTRTWTDSTGEFTVHAEFAGYSAGNVKLKKADGTILTLPLDQLSEDDQKWIKSRR